MKASDIIRPEQNQTKYNVCFPGEDGARESEMRANYIPRDAAASRDEAAKIRQFMARPTDPNSTKGVKSHMNNTTTGDDYARFYDKDDDGESARNKLKHTKKSDALGYENADPEYVSQTRSALNQSLNASINGPRKNQE